MVTEQVLAPVRAETLADYTQPELILLPLREQDTAGVIAELSQALQQRGCVPDVLPLYHTALNQELLADSGPEFGLAFPHARLSGVRHLQFAFGRASEPIPWGARGAGPVRLIFLLAVPATDAAAYLHLLASLARLARLPRLRRRLLAARTPQGVLSTLQEVKLREG